VLSAWGKLPKPLIPIVFALQELLGQFVWAKAQREACLINDTANLRGHMNNKFENSKVDISAPTKLTNQSEYTKIGKNQGKQQKFLQRIIAVSFVAQAALMGVKGNLDVLSGKSPLDVIPWMITQGIELILKAHRAEKSIKESDSKALLR
jgi:hypothetical protein